MVSEWERRQQINTRYRQSCRLCVAVVEERPLSISDHLIQLRDGYPISSGHQLLVTRRHERSFAAFLDAERRSCRTGSSEFVRSYVHDRVVIEHGPPATKKWNSEIGCIDHAHLHSLPRSSTSVQDIRAACADVTGTSLRWSDMELTESRPSDSEGYLWVSDGEVSFYAPLSDPVPHQIARRAFAAVLGLEVWNWRRSNALAALHRGPAAEGGG